MKQTIKQLAITFGKKVWAALVSAVAMIIGEAIISFFSKGFRKFRANRKIRKAETTDADTTKLSDGDAESTQFETTCTEFDDLLFDKIAEQTSDKNEDED